MRQGSIWQEGKVSALAWRWFATHALRARCLKRRDMLGVNECERELQLIEMRLVELGHLPPRRIH